MNLIGAGASTTIIHAVNNQRVMTIASTTVISGLTIMGGNSLKSSGDDGDSGGGNRDNGSGVRYSGGSSGCFISAVNQQSSFRNLTVALLIIIFVMLGRRFILSIVVLQKSEVHGRKT